MGVVNVNYSWKEWKMEHKKESGSEGQQYGHVRCKGGECAGWKRRVQVN